MLKQANSMVYVSSLIHWFISRICHWISTSAGRSKRNIYRSPEAMAAVTVTSSKSVFFLVIIDVLCVHKEQSRLVINTSEIQLNRVNLDNITLNLRCSMAYSAPLPPSTAAPLCYALLDEHNFCRIHLGRFLRSININVVSLRPGKNQQRRSWQLTFGCVV